MAIDTNNEKFSLIVFGRTTDPKMLPVTGGAIEEDDQQQLLWLYSGIAFETVALPFVLDMNTRVRQYLIDAYSANESTASTTTLVRRYLDAAAGDATEDHHQLIDDATP
jgi:hypothetical protein